MARIHHKYSQQRNGPVNHHVMRHTHELPEAHVPVAADHDGAIPRQRFGRQDHREYRYAHHHAGDDRRIGEST
jgi:hypothetical protein